MLLHEEAHGFFPGGGWGWRWTGDPDRGTGITQPAGWNYPLLPFIEQQSLYELGTDGQANVITDTQRDGALQRDQTPVSVFVCPSRRRNTLYPRPRNMNYINGRNVNRAAVVDYAACGGDRVLWHSGPGDINAGLSPTYDWNAGGAQENTGISFARSEISIGEVKDGTTNTIMLGEKSLMPTNYTDGMNSADDFGVYEGCAHDTYRWTHSPPLQDRIGVDLFSNFGGPHSNGCHFVLCDGSVRSINFSIDLTTYLRLGNRSDGQVIDFSKL
jgi:prepilin-type processing-associated H-X9-DG protein